MNTKILVWIIGPFIWGLALLWYNHVLLQRGISYWQALLFSTAIVAAWQLCKPMQWIWNAVFAIVIILQAAAWCGFVTLPLFRALN